MCAIRFIKFVEHLGWPVAHKRTMETSVICLWFCITGALCASAIPFPRSDADAVTLMNLVEKNLKEVKPLVQKNAELARQRRDRERIPILHQMIAIYAKADPVLKPQTDTWIAVAFQSLGAAHANIGQYSAAERFTKRSIAMLRKIPSEKKELIKSMLNLTRIRLFQGRAAEADADIVEIEQFIARSSNAELKFIAGDLGLIGLHYVERHLYQKAEREYKKAIFIQKNALGQNNATVVDSMVALGELYFFMGRRHDAEDYMTNAIAMSGKVLKEDRAYLAPVLTLVGQVYRKLGRYEDAQSVIERAIAVNERALGDRHPDVAAGLGELALVKEMKGELEDAESLARRALAIAKQAQSPSVIMIAERMQALAQILRHENKLAEAADLVRSALKTFEVERGPESDSASIALNDLASILFRQGKHIDAKDIWERIANRKSSSDHNFYKSVLQINLGLVSVALKNDDAAIRYFNRAWERGGAQLNGVNRDVLIEGLVGATGRTLNFRDAMSWIGRGISEGGAPSDSFLPTIMAARDANALSQAEAFDTSFRIEQLRINSAAAKAINSLAVRFAAGSGRLAQIVRSAQDLENEANALEKAITSELATEFSKRNLVTARSMESRMVAIEAERRKLADTLQQEFPNYVALSKGRPISASDIQQMLEEDESFVILDVGDRSYVWIITKEGMDWRELQFTEVEAAISAGILRKAFGHQFEQGFDANVSFQVFQKTLGTVENWFRSKKRLNIVAAGPLTGLPPHLLVRSNPNGKQMKEVDWLIRSHAITIWPSVANFQALRTQPLSNAKKPLVAFADPVFNARAVREKSQMAVNLQIARGIASTADVATLANGLLQLPETAEEGRKVAGFVATAGGDIFTGNAATETRVKAMKLDDYKVVYFATHGLVAGQVAEFAKLKAEPALVLSIPERPTLTDDGLLTASEVAQLKLDADWIVLSACNTAAAGRPGAEALSGLARAFFYAGGRSLIVSHWEVDSNSAVQLLQGVFRAASANPKASHGEAMRAAMLEMIGDQKHPERANPNYWAPFVVVGEPGRIGY